VKREAVCLGQKRLVGKNVLNLPQNKTLEGIDWPKRRLLVDVF
jgi:hypothetical protein